jgi:SAM-dependent methyltransferase
VVSLAPYEDDFFDVAFDGDCPWMVIGDHRTERLANVFRILKPGGIFFAQAHIMCGEFKDSYEIPHEQGINQQTIVTILWEKATYPAGFSFKIWWIIFRVKNKRLCVLCALCG